MLEKTKQEIEVMMHQLTSMAVSHPHFGTAVMVNTLDRTLAEIAELEKSLGIAEDSARAKMKVAHDLLDSNGVYQPDGTHSGLVDRIKILVDRAKYLGEKPPVLFQKALDVVRMSADYDSTLSPVEFVHKWNGGNGVNGVGYLYSFIGDKAREVLAELGAEKHREARVAGVDTAKPINAVDSQPSEKMASETASAEGVAGVSAALLSKSAREDEILEVVCKWEITKEKENMTWHKLANKTLSEIAARREKAGKP